MNVLLKEPKQQAQACVIWMHGLGADAQDMMGLANELPLHAPVRHVFLNAPVRPVTLNNRMPMRAWYDILGMQLTDREDRVGIEQSEQLIREAIAVQCANGLASHQIFLAGFSQGGAMALHVGIHTESPLAGVIALSAYLPLSDQCQVVQDRHTPFFLAGGLYDPMVLPAWTTLTVNHLRQQGFDTLVFHEYPMEHSICKEEVADLAHWIDKQVTALGSHQRGAL